MCWDLLILLSEWWSMATNYLIIYSISRENSDVVGLSIPPGYARVFSFSWCWQMKRMHLNHWGQARLPSPELSWFKCPLTRRSCFSHEKSWNRTTKTFDSELLKPNLVDNFKTSESTFCSTTTALLSSNTSVGQGVLGHSDLVKWPLSTSR